jgi:WhiB family redox-sensing transcriptional regulator
VARQWIERKWQDDAACRGPLAEVFYPPSDHERRTERAAREARAKAICASCPVRRDCLDHALTAGEWHGVWGGLNEAERRGLAPLRRGA